MCILATLTTSPVSKCKKKRAVSLKNTYHCTIWTLASLYFLKNLNKKGAGEKKSPRLFISTVWNVMYVIKNVIMYVIKKLKRLLPDLTARAATFELAARLFLHYALNFSVKQRRWKIFHYLLLCPWDSTLFLAIIILTDSIYTCLTCKCVFSMTDHWQKWHFKKDNDSKGLRKERKSTTTTWSPVSERCIRPQKTKLEHHLRYSVLQQARVTAM